MKLQELSKWQINKDTEGLLFFAQALEEMLFHHSLDSFKAPALNAHSNIIELLFFAYEFNNGTFRTSNSFSHVIEELEFNLRNDPVVDMSEGSIFAKLIINIKSSQKPIQLLNAVRALNAEFEHEYWIKLNKYILEKVSENKEKTSIIKAIKSFCVEAELIGHSREYIYRITQDFFFLKRMAPKLITHSNQLEDFLKNFAQADKNYDVYLRVKIPTNRYKMHLEKNKIHIINDLDEDLNKLRTFRLLKRDKKGFEGYYAYIKIQKIKSKDPYSAREFAESRLRMVYSAYTFLDHETNINIHPSCIVVCTEEHNKESFFRARPHPMEKGSSRNVVPDEILSQTFTSTFRSFTSQATHQLFRVFDYHSAAMSSNAPESQLVSLWAALEGLFPSPAKSEKGIDYYLAMLLPALVLTYSEKIFLYLTDALSHSSENSKNIILKNSQGSDFFEKVIYFIVAEETIEKSDELTSSLSNYPLLRNRCYWCHTHFNSAKSIYNTLQIHKQWISWHLRRIYLARNQILHHDQTLPYLPTLVENLHSYLDIILNSIIKLGQRSVDHKISIPTAFELLATHESIFISSLKSNESVCNNSNFKEIVFGRHNPLSPFYYENLSK